MGLNGIPGQASWLTGRRRILAFPARRIGPVAALRHERIKLSVYSGGTAADSNGLSFTTGTSVVKDHPNYPAKVAPRHEAVKLTGRGEVSRLEQRCGQPTAWTTTLLGHSASLPGLHRVAA